MRFIVTLWCCLFPCFQWESSQSGDRSYSFRHQSSWDRNEGPRILSEEPEERLPPDLRSAASRKSGNCRKRQTMIPAPSRGHHQGCPQETAEDAVISHLVVHGPSTPASGGPKLWLLLFSFFLLNFTWVPLMSRMENGGRESGPHSSQASGSAESAAGRKWYWVTSW